MKYRTIWTIIALIPLLFAVGCSEALECGPNTTEEDGQCVATASSCGEGTQLVGGTCVPASESVDCAEGTEEADGECVPEVECGPDTEPDASGVCTPTYERVECGTGTTSRDGECVPTALRIKSDDHPDEIQASDTPEQNLKPVTITWAGDPTWPVTAKMVTTEDCPTDLECRVKTWTIESEQNPMTLDEALGCWGDPDAVGTVQAGVYLIDAEQRQSNLVDVSFECVSE